MLLRLIPCLLDVPNPKMPEHDNQIMLLIDNNKSSLALVLDTVRKSMDKDEREAAKELRELVFDTMTGPSTAALYDDHDLSTMEHLEKELQELMDSTEPYARSYTYWIDFLNHYRGKVREGCDLQEYLPEAMDKKKEEEKKAAKLINGTAKIEDSTKSILRKCKINVEEGLVKLPDYDLEGEYPKVKKVMVFYGGKWSIKHQAFEFRTAAQVEKLKAAIDEGAFINQQKKKQAFYTPQKLVLRMIKIVGIKRLQTALEPSAGGGMIAKALRDAGALVRCVELDEHDAKELKDDGFVTVCGDFLKQKVKEQYDRVVMNPPFTKNQDIKHVLHAYKFLKPGGKLISVMSGTVMSNNTKLHREFQLLVGQIGFPHEVPNGTFKESGTNIKTVLIELRKPRE